MKSKTSYRAPAPQTPTNSSECQRGFAQPQMRYTPRCNTCEGRREIIALRGGMRPCPKCSEE